MSKSPLPKLEDVRATLAALLGRKVTITKAKETGAKTIAFAPYVTDQGAVHAVAAFELPLAAGVGGALSMVPASVVNEGLRAGALGAAESDGFVEACNVLAQLLNASDGPHVTVGDVALPPSGASADTTALVASAPNRLALQVDVEGYGGGRVIFVSA